MPDDTSNFEHMLAMSVPLLRARIRELETRLEQHEHTSALTRALMSVKGVPAPKKGRPVDQHLPGRNIAWALASAPGGSIERWIEEHSIDMKPRGRVRDSVHSRIRTFVFASLDERERLTGEVVSLGRREQITTRLYNYAKAGRVKLGINSL